MASPFPGMDPYLEHPSLWLEVHHRLITAIANALEENLSVAYRVAIEQRIYRSTPDDMVLVSIPDVAISTQSKQPTLPIQSTATVASLCLWVLCHHTILPPRRSSPVSVQQRVRHA